MNILVGWVYNMGVGDLGWESQEYGYSWHEGTSVCFYVSQPNDKSSVLSDIILLKFCMSLRSRAYTQPLEAHSLQSNRPIILGLQDYRTMAIDQQRNRNRKAPGNCYLEGDFVGIIYHPIDGARRMFRMAHRDTS